MGNDPSARNGRNGRHPLTAVNNHLEQAGRGTSIRGRGSMRQNSQNGPVGPNMPPPSPASGYGQGPPVPQLPDSRRHDLFANDPVNGAGSVPSGHPPQAQVASNDRFPPSRPAPNDRRADLMDDRNRDDGRHSSRHSSRERGPEADMRESHRNGERGGLSGGYNEESRRSGRPRENEGPIRPDDGNIRSGGHSGNRGGYGHDRGGYGGGDRGGHGLGRGDPRGQKHGRDTDINPYPGPGAGRSGMRNASENKRVRRGG